MKEIKVYYDPIGETLTVWFGNPQDEYICEETGEEVILMKDKHGRVIGFEKLYFSVPSSERLQFSFEELRGEEFVATL